MLLFFCRSRSAGNSYVVVARRPHPSRSTLSCPLCQAGEQQLEDALAASKVGPQLVAGSGEAEKWKDIIYRKGPLPQKEKTFLWARLKDGGVKSGDAYAEL